MKRFLSTLNKLKKLPICITENAWIRMSDIIKDNISQRFLFTASGGGCSGFKYDLTLINEYTYNELYGILKYNKNTLHSPTTLYKDNVKLTIDPVTEMILLGTTIDYIKKDYEQGVFENTFVFIPDKEYGISCGCGKSFQPHDI